MRKQALKHQKRSSDLKQPIQETITIVTTTVSNLEEARSISLALIKKKLAACINIIGPVLSIYQWEGKTQEEHEYKLFIKTKKSYWKQVESFISQKHSYSVPEISQLSVEHTHAPYRKWLLELLDHS